MKAPQIILIVLYSLSLLLNATDYHKDKRNFWIRLVAVSVNIGLLIWGGFFG